MKKLLIPLVILAMFAGGGASAWFLYLRDLVMPEGDAEEVVARNTPGFVKFDKVLMPVIQGGQVIYHLTLSITVELSDEDHVVPVKRHSRRLQNAFITELHALFARRFVQEQGLTGPLVRRRLLEIAQAMFGKDKVIAVSVFEVDRRVPSPVS